MKHGKIKELLKQLVLMAGILLWIGALSPEIFVETGLGCLADENGKEITGQEAEAFLETFFYSGENDDEEITVEYKSLLLEWLQSR